MKRRDFIALIGGAAVAWPLAARAQQPPKPPTIGFLHTRSRDTFMPNVARFLKGLSDAGFVEGRDIAMEYRFVDGHYDRLPAMAAELVRLPVAVLVAGGGEPSALAATAATASIPIVFVMGSDPVKAGLVATYNRPGGNVTGMNILTDFLETKRLGLLHELVPQAATIGYLSNPRFVSAPGQLRDVAQAARTIAVTVRVLPASTETEIDAAFETIVRERIPALAVGADPFLDNNRDRIIALAARHAVPTMYQFREQAISGGLASYGVDTADVYRQVGGYVARILKGESPANLPILEPTKFEFILNLKSAKALGLAIRPDVLSIADEVIE
jgi:putative ABC transport system substrate-binding protein